MSKSCQHLKGMPFIEPEKHQCDKCIATGDHWVHLRICQTCGEVNCCDSSKNQHATRHFLESGHPAVVSAEPGERWAWCYQDQSFVEY